MQRSSILTELAWLASFFAVFVLCVYLFEYTLVIPHHFNDKISVTLAAIVAGLVMIFLRSRSNSGRRKR